MEEEKTTQNENGKAPEKPKTPRAPKGTVIPTMAFSDFIQVMSDIGGRDVKRGPLAVLANVLGNSEKSSTFINKTIALKNFSAITVTGDEFELTSIGEGIAYPKSDDHKILSIQKAFAAHPILNKVWHEQKGRDFVEQYVPNIIVSVGGVPDEMKNEWAAYFTDAIRTARLTKNTGGKEIVLSDFIKPGHSKTEEQQLPPGGKDIPPPPQPGNADTLEQLSSKLTGGMKLNAKAGDCYVLVYIDGDLTEEEAAKITTIFEAGTLLIKSRIVKKQP